MAAPQSKPPSAYRGRPARGSGNQPKPPHTTLPDAVRNEPTVILTTATVRAQLVGWIAECDGARPLDGSSPSKDVTDLVRAIEEMVSSWIDDLDEAEL